LFLEEHSIPYEDVNVASDKEARQEMVDKTGQMGVPVIQIDGDIVVGYDEQWLKEKLGL